MKNLRHHLLYLKISDLREICTSLGIYTGLKMFMVEGIVHYMERNGSVLEKDVIPVVSRAKKDKACLEKDALMLYGAYKHDKKTREFFQSIIGQHFHFTAYGIDYVKARWLSGNPPTYSEFASWWSQEYEKRKIEKPVPKDEWQYIQFCQNNPGLTKKDLKNAWQKEYDEHKAIVYSLIRKHIDKMQV